MTEWLLPSTSTTVIPYIKTAEVNEDRLRQIDIFIKAASITAYKKGLQNVGIVSCFYSLNIRQNNIKNYIFSNPGKSLRLIVPVIHDNRIVLMVFFSEDNRVEYYDSLKKEICEKFHAIKDAVESLLGLKFNMTNQKSINESINDNAFPLLANVHICRIAEEMCFLYRYRKLNPFEINDEAKRIKKILDIVVDPRWNGEWIFNLKDKLFGAAFDKVVNIPSCGNVISSLTSGTSATSSRRESVTSSKNLGTNFDVIEIDDGEFDTGVAHVSQNQSDKNIDSIIDEVVNSVNRIFEKDTVAAEKNQAQILSISNNFDVNQNTVRNLHTSNTPPHTTILYKNKCPILTQMLKFYSKITQFRNDTYKNPKITVASTFNWNAFTAFNTAEKEKGTSLLTEFPYFSELPKIDKSSLLQRFWSPFWLFERIYDTVNTLDPNTPGNFIMLQDKTIYDLDAIINDPNFENRKSWEKLIFEFWHSMIQMMKEIKPEIIEVMYIFCCILWNSDYLNIELSEEGEEIIQRWRLVIHKEMQEFYGYDKIKWNRIILLRKMLFLTENCVKEYKKSL